MLLGAIEAGWDAEQIRPWFTGIVSDHHLSYGHAAIYSQKAFQLLDMIGWERAGTVLPYLVPTIVYGTREDKLPYMRPFVKALARARPGRTGRASNPSPAGTTTVGCSKRCSAKRGSNRCTRPSPRCGPGAGIDRVLDVVVAAVSERMLRYEPSGEFDFHDDFGWLDITHGITYANAVRWHNAHLPGPDAVRLALWCVFQANWTGRHEWHTGVGRRAEIEPRSDDLTDLRRGAPT